jgi:hypothetical protein
LNDRIASQERLLTDYRTQLKGATPDEAATQIEKLTSLLAETQKSPIEPDEDQAICGAQPEPRRRGPLQDNKLLAEKCHLGFASRTRSE